MGFWDWLFRSNKNGIDKLSNKPRMGSTFRRRANSKKFGTPKRSPEPINQTTNQADNFLNYIGNGLIINSVDIVDLDPTSHDSDGGSGSKSVTDSSSDYQGCDSSYNGSYDSGSSTTSDSGSSGD